MTDKERLVELLREVDNMRLMRCGFKECADHILADGWIRLPCKVGDTLYAVVKRKFRKKKIFEVKVLGINFDRAKTVAVEAGKDYGMIYDLFLFDEFGKTIFPTREEAEKALRGGAECL